MDTFRILFLEYESGLWDIENHHIWGSVTVSGMFQDYKTRSDSLLGGFRCETSDMFLRWVFLGISDLAMI